MQILLHMHVQVNKLRMKGWIQIVLHSHIHVCGFNTLGNKQFCLHSQVQVKEFNTKGYMQNKSHTAHPPGSIHSHKQFFKGFGAKLAGQITLGQSLTHWQV